MDETSAILNSDTNKKKEKQIGMIRIIHSSNQKLINSSRIRKISYQN